jgi:hypothetical protein
MAAKRKVDIPGASAQDLLGGYQGSGPAQKLLGLANMRSSEEDLMANILNRSETTAFSRIRRAGPLGKKGIAGSLSHRNPYLYPKEGAGGRAGSGKSQVGVQIDRELQRTGRLYK